MPANPPKTTAIKFSEKRILIICFLLYPNPDNIPVSSVRDSVFSECISTVSKMPATITKKLILRNNSPKSTPLDAALIPSSRAGLKVRFKSLGFN